MADRNTRILAAALALPQGRGYRFTPSPRAEGDPVNPRDPEHDGTSRTLVVDGEVVARASGDGATYCCGVTFEAWLDAGVPPGTSAEELRRVVTEWFCPTMGHDGVVSALVSRGWGRRVELADAIPGDLCQFWRSVDLARPSGHSVVFLGFSDGRLRYWSSQRATGGVGVHEEEVGPGWQLHLVRATDATSAAPRVTG
jgi:hypothetical protein